MAFFSYDEFRGFGELDMLIRDVFGDAPVNVVYENRGVRVYG